MLSLHHHPDRVRRAENLIPRADGSFETRDGAVQVVDGAVEAARPWGDRVVFQQAGRVRVWDGASNDIAPANGILQIAPFQAALGDGTREDRVYVQDGVNPLWFIAARAGSYATESVVNTIADATGTPYPLPLGGAIASWRGRLWIPDGPAARHCQFESPSEWDPLWTVPLQGIQPGRVVALQAHGEGRSSSLIAGTTAGVWQIAGLSQYDWTYNEVAFQGVPGPQALASDGQRLAMVNAGGIFLDSPELLVSEDLRDAFEYAPLGTAELAIDHKRRRLLALIRGRMYVMHLDRPGYWGEICGTGAFGLLRLESYVGWYGLDGIWLMAGRDIDDQFIDGTRRAVRTRYETWPQRPNMDGAGRALCNRVVMLAEGSVRAPATYTLDTDLVRGAFSQDVTFTADGPRWGAAEGEAMTMERPEPGRVEVVPRIAGSSFTHSLTSDAYLRVAQFEPRYRFGENNA